MELYMPNSVSIGDSMSYNSNVDLGTIGATAQNVYKQLQDKSASFKGVVSQLWDVGKTLGRQSVPSQTIQNILSLEQKVVVNPHTNTLFERVGVRSFSFSFKLIASSKEEAGQILSMINTIRYYIYPEIDRDNSHLLKFPPLWDITFLHKGQENVFMPKIHTCFLNEFSSSYNNESNSWHYDGAPFDVSIQMSFMETKTYNRNNILHGDGNTFNTPDADALANATPIEPDTTNT
jgi:hypothetical protein